MLLLCKSGYGECDVPIHIYASLVHRNTYASLVLRPKYRLSVSPGCIICNGYRQCGIQCQRSNSIRWWVDYYQAAAITVAISVSIMLIFCFYFCHIVFLIS